jgi:hypothetical protein
LYRPAVLRALLALAVIAAAAALAGCDSNKIPDISGRHMQPLSEAMLAELDTKNMRKESPILIRIFKEESELELWKVDKSGRFALLRTYPICRWSGDLGPKTQEGDRQAPEGFYSITPNLMNPNSNYHLAINTGSASRSMATASSFRPITRFGNCRGRSSATATSRIVCSTISMALPATAAPDSQLLPPASIRCSTSTAI